VFVNRALFIEFKRNGGILMKLSFFLLIAFSPFLVGAQLTAKEFHITYEVNNKVELFSTSLLFTGVCFGYSRIGANGRVKENQLLGLNQSNVNPFDRNVFSNEAAGFGQAKSVSDILLAGSVIAPVFMLIDRSIRAQWKSVFLLYFEAQVLNSMIYQLAAFSIERARPLSYSFDLTNTQRTAKGTSNSFFSGHTSSTAVASFFMAQVISDVHQLAGKQRAALLLLATVPPAVMGYLRIKAGKHFRTDVLIGGFVGAVSAVLVPVLHKKNRKLSVIPVINLKVKGVSLSYNLS